MDWTQEERGKSGQQMVPRLRTIESQERKRERERNRVIVSCSDDAKSLLGKKVGN